MKADSASLAAALAGIGYPGFRQLAGAPTLDAKTILLESLSARDLETRILEGLPWIVLSHTGLDWDSLVREATQRHVQNRLGFVVSLARQVAERRKETSLASRLRQVEAVLESSKISEEDTLCQALMSDAERRWLRQNRPVESSRWNLLTDLKVEFLPYAA